MKRLMFELGVSETESPSPLLERVPQNQESCHFVEQHVCSTKLQNFSDFFVGLRGGGRECVTSI